MLSELPEAERWEALARYVAGESPAEEARQIRSWLDEDPRRHELLATLERSFATFEGPAADVDVEAALARVSDRLEGPDVRRDVRRIESARAGERRAITRRTILLRAATVGAVVIGGTLLFRGLRHDDAAAPAGLAPRSFATATGQVDSVRLSDGTRVVLAPGSEIVLAYGYGTSSRELVLNGEAFFDVVQDDARPFTVHAGRAVVRDLGTAFSVRTSGAREVRVVVTAGSVLLRHETRDSGAILRAGDRGTLAGELIVAQSGTATPDDLAWTRGRLVFDNASIAHVADELRRWYGIELRVPQSVDRHVTAAFEGEDVNQVLDVIGLVLGARIERRGDTAFVQLPAQDITR